MKYCPHCKKKKPKADFNKNAYQKDGLQIWCRQCDNGDSTRKNPKTNAIKIGLKWHPEADYELLWEFQNNQCWICGIKQNGRRLHRDHNHKSGWVRGLLCENCNHSLPSAYCDDSITKARKYLISTGMKQILVDMYVDYLKNPPYFQLLASQGIQLSKKSQKNYDHFLKEGTPFSTEGVSSTSLLQAV